MLDSKDETVAAKSDSIVIDTNKLFTIIQTGYNDLLKYDFNSNPDFIADSSFHRKVNGVLKLKLEGSQIEYVDKIDTADETSNLTYNYIGHFEKLKLHVVENVGYEYYHYYLIPYNMDTIISTWREPKASTNGKYIASIISVGMEGDPVGFEIFDLSKPNRPSILFNQDKWVPLAFCWDKNDLIIKAAELEEYMKTNDFPDRSSFCLRIRLK
jgi:hypothetical protein